MNEHLARLCARHGVLTEYHDVWGHRHHTPDGSLKALLAELGVGADAAEGPPERTEPLPPLWAIAADSDAWTIELRLPARAPASIAWTVLEESGTEHHGEVPWADLSARSSETPEGVVLQATLEIGLALPSGYHRLSVQGVETSTLLVSAPPRCYQPAPLRGDERTWGPAVQLYALRSERNWGMGDFGDLGTLVDQWAARGAGLVGVNPLHAMFSHNPAHASPYSPSSRQLLNTLYIDVDAVPDLAECRVAQQRIDSPEFQQRLDALRATDEVDYPGVAAAKHEILRLLYASFREKHLAPRSLRAGEFRRFLANRGKPLRAHATFEALQAHFHAADASVWGWPVWPEAYRDPASPAVAQFVAEHANEVQYHEYLQWLADTQLATLSRRCKSQGMAVGLYLDLAVSVDRAGSDTWGHQQSYARSATVGAPPDELQPNGQGWGLPPLRPDGLRRDISLFVQSLRATMRHAGAVRIDHVMGLMRLYWIPDGWSARDGGYVLYPLDQLMAVVALESERNRCMVIGEDLGTVAEEIRAAMSQYQLLSYRLLYFEREHGGVFKAPHTYPRHALVAVSTHDLPTLAGWWSGHDIEVRETLTMYPHEHTAREQRQARAHERHRLLEALAQAKLLPPGIEIDTAANQPLSQQLADAIHAYVASTPAQVMVVQLEDVLGMVDQANLPGTVNEHPNWRRKLPIGVEALADDTRARTLAARLHAVRPSPQVQEAPAASPAPRGRSEAVIPRATYRLQFHPGFTFDDAVKVLPYLQRLGVSHVYCSPIMKARPGSQHGYDIVSHDEVNPELGGQAGFERFSAAARGQGLGLLLDVVPNHMGVHGEDNDWWMDVLENGPNSPFARHFDIDWHPVNRELEGKVLVPILGSHYGDVLGNGLLQLAFEPELGGLALRYHEHRFPLNPRTYPVVLALAAERLPEGDERQTLTSLSDELGRLPAHAVASAPARSRAKDELKARLATLVRQRPAVAGAIESAVTTILEEDTRDTLHGLHEAQCYRLAYWRVAADEINYRRFFDINELAAVRVEEPAVFEATHRFPLELAAAGVVDGLRIDHPDGLHDPAQYFRRLQQGYARRAGIELETPDDPQARPERPLYVLAEKIAAPHEDVPASWHIHGTTGYRFAMVANGVLVDTAAADRFDRIWHRFSGERASFGELAYRGKRRVARTALASELTVLATALLRIARADRSTRDFTYNALRDALAEVAACMPVYRTYVMAESTPQDLRYVDWAIAHARRRAIAIDPSVFAFIGSVLRGHEPATQRPAERNSKVRQFAARFQQFSAPVAAKGVEDTAYYRYHRLVALNEVGGDPAQFGMTVRAFHGATADRAARWPHTILATSTHDNKRSEDVRTRLDVLSEMPGAWRLGLARWRRLAAGHRTLVDGDSAPSASDEYLLYQTLLGTLPAEGLDDAGLPAYRERIHQYMLKAAREAKRHTGWTHPDEAYEDALAAFVHGVLARVQPNPLLTDLQASAKILAWYGALNSLSLVLMKFTSPGVPDIYQGTELLDLSLVDPDNRRPVDYELRSQWLDELKALADGGGHVALDPLDALAATPLDGRAKLWVTWRLLALRRREPALFKDGSYTPLAVSGAQEQQMLAYARQVQGRALVVMVGRLYTQLSAEPGQLPLGTATWGDTTVELPPELLQPARRWQDVLSGVEVQVVDGRLKVADACAHLPLAALVSMD